LPAFTTEIHRLIEEFLATRTKTTNVINADIESLKETEKELSRQKDAFKKFKTLADGGLSTAKEEFSIKVKKLEKILDENQRLEDSVS
jgi:hypothetical protein